MTATPGGRPRGVTAPAGRAAVIAGAGSWVPPRLVTNDDLVRFLDTSDAWIRDRTGIGQRRHVTPGLSTGDLAVEAGRRALRAAGEPAVDAVVLATTTPDRLCPATAPDVSARLGFNGIPAFDVSAVCAGFLYGLATVAGMIATRTVETVLLIGADSFSTIVDPADRSTAPIFGDGAGAVVIRAGDTDEPGAVGPVVLGSDGDNTYLIGIPAGGSRQRSAGSTVEPGDNYLHMRGRDTYRHAVERMTQAGRTALALAGWATSDVDRFAGHQANARILDAVADRLGVPAGGHRLSNIERVGNTAAASIPLLLTESAAAGLLRPGDRTLLTAFGAGLSWGAATVVWPEVTALAGTGDTTGAVDTPAVPPAMPTETPLVVPSTAPLVVPPAGDQAAAAVV
ncbi:ketoacyl-ACP synthase III [Frankia sp. Cpl3]|uniref:beta-ketoacyl-ACP synthase III n=1 Tax=Parafrankia colletiae TaxID=573497 RepID=UPI000AB37C47|nr:beta-ketoacyl-ACP synthase III [Parafrankia colletiae]MCK9902328.1 ketoacyl-ACP synthase III [Frankia sp. Cpl3]